MKGRQLLLNHIIRYMILFENYFLVKIMIRQLDTTEGASNL